MTPQQLSVLICMECWVKPHLRLLGAGGPAHLPQPMGRDEAWQPGFPLEEAPVRASMRGSHLPTPGSSARPGPHGGAEAPGGWGAPALEAPRELRCRPWAGESHCTPLRETLTGSVVASCLWRWV